MNGKLIDVQIEHHKKQIAILEKELSNRKAAGDKRVQKMQDEITHEIGRILQNINMHKAKIKELQSGP